MMSIKCLLCGNDFQIISATHLKPAHNITTEEYLEMFPNAETFDERLRQQIAKAASQSASRESKSAETRQSMSDAHIGKTPSEETRRQISDTLLGNQNALGHTVSEETRKLMSDVHMGHGVSKETKKLLSDTLKGREVSKKTRKLMSDALIGREVGEETKKLMSKTAKENWKDPEFSRMMFGAWNRKPNLSELQLQSVLDKHFPGEWKYVGDGQVRFGGRNPDFLNVNHQKQVIEMFGIYWHDPDLFPNRLTEEELIAHYKEYGIDCLVVWEYNIWDEDEVVRRVMEVSR